MSESSRGFYFLRHGETTSNALQISSGGEQDPDLTQLGCEQSLEVGKILQEVVPLPGLIVCSPLKRTTHTAEIVNQRFGLEFLLVEKFIERKLGDWNDQSSEITDPLLFSGQTPPNGESKAEFRTRVFAGFQELTDVLPRWPLIVASRGIARVLLEHTGYPQEVNFPNGGLLRLELSKNVKQFEVSKIERLNQ